MSVYDNIYKLVNRIGTTPEIYKKDIPMIINNMLYNKLDLDVTTCKMISGNINKNTVVYIIFCDSYINLDKPVLEKVLTLDEDKENYLLLIRSDIVDLNAKVQTKQIFYIYDLLTQIIQKNTIDDNLSQIISIILTLLSLYGIYKDSEEFKNYIINKSKIFLDKKEYNIDGLIDDVFETLELDASFPITRENIIESLINNYELYKFINKKDDK